MVASRGRQSGLHLAASLTYLFDGREDDVEVANGRRRAFASDGGVS